jgi:hypothetical protein
MIVLLLPTIVYSSNQIRHSSHLQQKHNSNNNDPIKTLNGTWDLEKATNIACTEELLKLIGVEDFKIRIIKALNVIESYVITETQIHFKRDTARSHKDQIFQFNKEEDIEDDILGKVKQTVTYQYGKIMMHMIRTNGGKTSTVRRFDNNNRDRIIYVSNYTTPGGVTKSCIRYFNRKV